MLYIIFLMSTDHDMHDMKVIKHYETEELYPYTGARKISFYWKG